ncbi:UBX domain-containing protein [Drechslerella dactyloides]|uniref:UBX domain-containing protein 2 n=1 Tax=Drechslerella dactyloides TaxID=74499 RepID=A0AAD6NLT0_DREDA|nr:UBX domain-containing protein [Drechslerella dactyloides]
MIRHDQFYSTLLLPNMTTAPSLFFSGTIEAAIAATVANRKPLVCFVTDDSDASSTWEREYLRDDAVSPLLQDAAITVRLLKDSTEANYLNAFCALQKFPTLLVIKNGGAGVDGLTVITDPISKEEFISKIQTTLNDQAPATLLDGVNSSPNFPATTASAPPDPAPAAPTAPSQEPASSTSTARPAAADDDLPANTQFPPDSATARRLASIQQQHRERIARLKAQREAAEREEAKKREIARRQDTRAMADAAETHRDRSNRQYADAEKKRRAEAEQDRRRVLEQIRSDREEMRIREANRKAIAAEAEAETQCEAPKEAREKGKQVDNGTGESHIGFRLLDGSRISHTFPADATIEKDVRPWLDKNRTDSNQPYKLVSQSVAMSSVNVEGTSTLRELDLYPSALLILKPVAGGRVSTAFAGRAARTNRPVTQQEQNFFIALLMSVWLMIKTFLGLHNPNASVKVGNKEQPSSEGSESSSGSARPARDAARKRFRTLHDGEDGDKRSAYYNGNQLDFEPRKKNGDLDEGEVEGEDRG